MKIKSLKLWSAVTATLLLLGLSGCGAIEVSDRDLVMATHARTVQAVEVGNALVVDVRSADFHEKGHIPGSLNIPIDELTVVDPRVALAPTVIVYSDGGSDPLARAAAKKLLSQGWIETPGRVRVYQGGTILWETSGLTLQGREAVEPEAGASTQPADN